MRELWIAGENRLIQLGPRLGKGGEGTVYQLKDDPTLAVKVYNEKMKPERARKIRELARWEVSHLDKFIARPRGLVHDSAKDPWGLVLPRVDRAVDVHQVYGPADLRKNFPDATWAFLVNVATNTARAFAGVHERGLVIGDVNQGSVMVRHDGTVRLIDVDSFQVPVPGSRPLLSTVAVPEYWPPELAGADLSRTVRTVQHDAFGLAVLIFQLLFQGRHPYSGVHTRGENTITDAIRSGRFAYSKEANRLGVTPPTAALQLTDLPSVLGRGFENAFAHPRQKVSRPSAQEWVALLGNLGTALRTCERDRTHLYPRSTSTCPWCRISGSTTPPSPVVATHQTDSGRMTAAKRQEAEFAKLRDRYRALPKPVTPTRPSHSPVPNPTPLARRRAGQVRLVQWTGVVAPVTAGVAALPNTGSLRAVFFALGIFVLVTAAMIRSTLRAPAIADLRSARTAHAAALLEFDRAALLSETRATRSAVKDVQREWQVLRNATQVKTTALTASSSYVPGLEAWLATRPIRSGTIPHIGDVRVRTLSLHRITTAADVDAGRLGRVPGFGPSLVQAVVDWRQRLERQYVAKHGPAPTLQIRAQASGELIAARQQVISTMKAAVDAADKAARADTTRVSEARRALLGAELDLREREATALAVLGKLPR